MVQLLSDIMLYMRICRFLFQLPCWIPYINTLRLRVMKHHTSGSNECSVSNFQPVLNCTVKTKEAMAPNICNASKHTTGTKETEVTCLDVMRQCHALVHNAPISQCNIHANMRSCSYDSTLAYIATIDFGSRRNIAADAKPLLTAVAIDFFSDVIHLGIAYSHHNGNVIFRI